MSIITRTNAIEHATRLLRDAKGPLNCAQVNAALLAEGHTFDPSLHVDGPLHYVYGDTVKHGVKSAFRFIGRKTFVLVECDANAANVHNCLTGDDRTAALKIAQEAARAARTTPAQPTTPAPTSSMGGTRNADAKRV